MATVERREHEPFLEVPLADASDGGIEALVPALLYEDERMEMWLLSWLPHHSTGFHDHGESSVGFCVAQGTLTEQYLRFADPPRAETLVVGDSRAAGSDYIHCLEWETGEPALSVHVYSPPLAVVGQYRYDDHGILHRHSQPGRDELTRD